MSIAGVGVYGMRAQSKARLHDDSFVFLPSFLVALGVAQSSGEKCTIRQVKMTSNANKRLLVNVSMGAFRGVGDKQWVIGKVCVDYEGVIHGQIDSQSEAVSISMRYNYTL